MSDTAIFEDLNSRLAAIVQEIIVVEDELKRLIVNRARKPKRIYWVYRVDFPRKASVFYCPCPEPIGLWSKTCRIEMTQKHIEAVSDAVKFRLKSDFGSNCKLKKVKVTVYSKSA